MNKMLVIRIVQSYHVMINVRFAAQVYAYSVKEPLIKEIRQPVSAIKDMKIKIMFVEKIVKQILPIE